MDNFAQAVESMDSDGSGDVDSSMAEELRRQQGLVTVLEAAISGAKLRYAAMLFLHESRSSSSAISGNLIDFTAIARNSDKESVNSILQNKFDWLPLPSSLSEDFTAAAAIGATKSNNEGKGKIKNKDSVASSRDEMMDLRVFSIPPAFAPIPCKPVFYDVALNHLDLTGGTTDGVGSQVSRDIDRRCGLKVKSVASKSKVVDSDVQRQRDEMKDNQEGGSNSSTGTTLVGAAAQSIYGWWSGVK